MEQVVLLDRDIFISRSYLIERGLSINTLKKWVSRNTVTSLLIKGIKYIKYSTIPRQTQDKLPSASELKSIIHEAKSDSKQSYYNQILTNAFEKGFITFRSEYEKDKRLTLDKITECARLRAVWEKILEHNNGARGATELLFKAFDSIYKGKYATYGAFCTVKTKARKDINSVVIDTRWFREQHSSIDQQVFYWAAGLVSNPLNDTSRTIWRKLNDACNKANIETPSYSWVKKFVREKERNPQIFASRYGREKAFNKLEPFATIIHAKNPGSQWQIDGWDLPFYYKGFYKGKPTSYLKLILVAVMDYHSKKFVGYCIGESENTDTILKAIENAVRNTGFLPFEILSDNHSFNKTMEANHFKEVIETIGVTWRVTSNPREKVIERYFRYLGEHHSKNYPGYLGQGLKTREKNGRPTQEYHDHFTKSDTWKERREVELIGHSIITEFNNAPLKHLGSKTPNEVHENTEKPYTFPINEFLRLKIFSRKSIQTIKRGQIQKLPGCPYEYQLTAEQFTKLNGKKVIVRYESSDMIYLFDEKTDEPITTVYRKSGIHGALADQTQEDIDKLNKNKGRLNGIKSKAKKEVEGLRDKTLMMHPNAFETLNRIMTPKHVLQEVKANYELKERVTKDGTNLEMAEVRSVEPMIISSLKPQESKDKNPYSVRGKHQVKKIDFTDNDEL